jgi:serine phosphatase RsbU (regulator of sigma subunit)/predicted negative regulator of RcsB-dependent stress response
MKHRYKIYFLFISIYFSSSFVESESTQCFAQNHNIDSLQMLVKKDKEDTTKVIHSNKLSKLYLNIGLYDTAFYFSSSALKLAQQLNFKKGVSSSNYHTGLIYSYQGNYLKALEYYFASLKIDEECDDKRMMAAHLGNIGIVYDNLSDYERALDYYFRALKLDEEIGEKKRTASWLGNIANIYSIQTDYHKAMDYCFKGLRIDEEFGNKEGMMYRFVCIGDIYKAQGKTKKALEYYNNALKLDDELGNKNATATTLLEMGILYTANGKYKEAELCLKRAIDIESGIGAMDDLRKTEEALSDFYTTTKQYKESLIHYQKAMVLKDSLFTVEKNKEITRHEMNREFQKKIDAQKAEQDIKDAITQAEKKKQQFIIILVSAILILVLAFVIFIFSSLRTTRKQKQTIEIKNIETEHQKKIIEEKNKDITDSIHYAKQIQSALLREEAHVSKHLPEHFILFLPKDIVSGDFYWGFEKHDYWYVAAADCTGHGVPGAIMSMLGISFLNDIVSSDALFSPAEILNQLRDRIISELRQTGEDGSSKDGMDISLVRLNLKTFELQWAGANNALNYIQADELKEVKADKQPIGYHPQQKAFTNHQIQLQKGDSIYIYSDGYADQFGGSKGKKLTYKKLDNFIIENYQLPLEKQKTLFREYFENWKGSLEQLDDVCVIGIKI